MPRDGQVSPRAAIQSWLQASQTKPRFPRQVEKTEAPVQRNRPRQRPRRPDHEGLRRSISPGTDHHPPAHTKDTEHRIGPKGNVTRTGTLPSQQVPEREGLNVAERLGLHTPFRRFKDHSDDAQADPRSLNRPPKRRHRESSTDSYLELAKIGDTTRGNRSAIDILQSRRSTRKQADTSAPVPSTDSIITPSSAQKPTKSYERRRRHKTRDDHYDLKDHDDNRRKKWSSNKDGSGRKSKQRKRKEKSGAALLHDFTAENVSQDRLTLQPSKPLGFFGKGRASSPFRRRGLPDLAFSEMTFLNARRAKPKEDEAKFSGLQPQKKNKRRKSTKVADTEAEISRYFTQAHSAEPNIKDQRQQQRPQNSRTDAQSHDSPPPFINLPEAPFLGFGSCGANSVSPVKQLSSQALRDLRRRLTGSPMHSTSYISWSQTASPLQRPSQCRKQRNTQLESRLSDSYVRSSTSPQENQDFRTPTTLPCVVNTPAETCGVNRNLTSKENAHCSSQHDVGYSPRRDMRQPSRAALTGEGQETQHPVVVADNNAKGAKESGKQRKRIPTFSDQGDGDSGLRRHATPWTMANQSGAQTAVHPITLNLGHQSTVCPLDEVLDTLLQECKTRRPVEEDVQSQARPPMFNMTKEENLANDHGDQSSKVSSCGSSRRQNAARPPPCVPFPTITRPECAKGYDRGDLREYELGSRGLQDAPWRHGTMSSQRSFPNMRAHSMQVSENSKGNSRSAWTGYEILYERQQRLNAPPLPDDVKHYYRYSNYDSALESDQSQFENCNQEPSYLAQEQGRIGDRGYSINDDLEGPRHNMYTEYEASEGDSGWREIQEHLFAEYEPRKSIGNPAQSNELGLESMIWEEPLQHSKLSEEIDELLQDAPGTASSWHNNDGYFPTNNGLVDWRGTKNAPDSADDAAMSRFWTPHKLY